MSKAKSLHRSLYFYDIAYKKVDTNSEIFAKKKFETDKDADFLTINKVLSHLIYFEDLDYESSDFLSDLSFYLPIYCSLLVKDFMILKL